MARLIIPDDFATQLTLLTSISAQNTALGANSPITAFLTQQGIVLSADVTAGASAQTHETSRALLNKQSENYRQLRDNYFKMPWQVLTGSAQFLKQFYRNNIKELGNWGITITDSGKVNYPPAFINRIAVFTAFAQKAASFTPATNPLKPYFTQQAVDMTKAATQVTQATANNNSFNTASQQSENETELRNQLWLPVLEHIKAIGNFLMKIYANNPKALGIWGFVVDDSPRKPSLRTTRLKLGEQITVSPVLVGSTLTNIGAIEIHVYKGKTTTGTPVIVHANEQYGILKGFSTITVVNPSTLQEAKFTVMVSK